jgi:hypothetical protein
MADKVLIDLATHLAADLSGPISAFPAGRIEMRSWLLEAQAEAHSRVSAEAPLILIGQLKGLVRSLQGLLALFPDLNQQAEGRATIGLTAQNDAALADKIVAEIAAVMAETPIIAPSVRAALNAIRPPAEAPAEIKRKMLSQSLGLVWNLANQLTHFLTRNTLKAGGISANRFGQGLADGIERVAGVIPQAALMALLAHLGEPLAALAAFLPIFSTLAAKTRRIRDGAPIHKEED